MLTMRSSGVKVLHVLALVLFFALFGGIGDLVLAGTWMTLPSPPIAVPGQLSIPRSIAVDGEGNVYVAELGTSPEFASRVQKRDVLGHWSVLASHGAQLGEIG